MLNERSLSVKRRTQDRFPSETDQGTVSALEPAVRFATSIVLDALAFVVWDVGTRPPLRLIGDVLRGMRTPSVLVRGMVRFLTGLALLVLAGFVARPAIATARTFTLLETWMIVAALLVETLIGNDLRSRTRRPG